MNRLSIWVAACAAIGLVACGGGSDSPSTPTSSNAGSSAAASSAVSSAGSSAASSVGSSAASSVSSSAASSVSSSTSSAASSSSSVASSAATTTFSPANSSANIHVDTRLTITFPSAPTLGTSGLIKVYKTSDDSLVDTLSLNVFNTGSTITSGITAATLVTNDVQTIVPRTNTEIDKLGNNVSTLSQYRFIFYKPVIISGNTATIRLHDNVLTPSTAYYVQVESGVLSTSAGAFSVADKTSWTFTTRAAPASTTSVTVDDDGTTADFRTVQGALNWITEQCGGTSAAACNSVAVAKTITVKNGTYTGDLFLRNVNNLTIQGETRAGVTVQSENFEQYNPGTGGSGAAPTTTTVAEVGGNRPRLNGGRAVFLVEGSDLLTLTNFTLKNTHVKNVWEGVTGSMNNQAETIYYNSATLAGSRLLAKQMNFLSTQDTIQVKGWVWVYQSLVAGDVDFVWGSPFAALLEESELRTVVDTTNAAAGGYVIETRAVAGFPGFVVLNSQLTKAAGVPVGNTYLSRQASNFSSTATTPGCTTIYTSGSLATANLGCNNVTYINTKMDDHIAALGWHVPPVSGANPPPITTPTTTTGYRESGTTNLSGGAVDLTSRYGAPTSTSLDLSGLNTRTKVFLQWNSNAGWVPAP